ncbi:MAG: HAD family hydrolase, partial [Halobacteriaceae archaeon]
FSDREAEIIWNGLSGSRNETLKSWGIDPDKFWEEFHDIEDPQIRASETYLYEDAEFIGELERPVGLVTHCQSFLAYPVLEQVDIKDWFDTIICCDESIGWKPDPEPVHRAMNDMGAKQLHHGVLAGDGECDIGAAWNAGLDGIHVERHDPHHRGHCVLGDYRIESFDELTTEEEFSIKSTAPSQT